MTFTYVNLLSHRKNFMKAIEMFPTNSVLVKKIPSFINPVRFLKLNKIQIKILRL